jgi:hypothetical protein
MLCCTSLQRFFVELMGISLDSVLVLSVLRGQWCDDGSARWQIALVVQIAVLRDGHRSFL